MMPVNAKVNVSISDSCNNCCRCWPWGKKKDAVEKKDEQPAQPTESPESVEVENVVIEERRVTTTHIHIPPIPAHHKNVSK